MKTYKFVRYGGLSSVRQKGYTPNNAMVHTPPARRGIYAMPYDMLEMFLISPITTRRKKSNRELINHHHEYVKNKKGEPIKLTWNYHHRGIPESSNTSAGELKKFFHTRYDRFLGKKIREYNSNFGYRSFWKEGMTEYSKDAFLYGLIIKPSKPKYFDYSGNIWCHLHWYVPVKRKDILKENGDWILLGFPAWLKYYTYAKKSNVYEDYGNRVHTNYGRDYFEVFIEKI
jgi:hypothetical protein